MVKDGKFGWIDFLQLQYTSNVHLEMKMEVDFLDLFNIWLIS